MRVGFPIVLASLLTLLQVCVGMTPAEQVFRQYRSPNETAVVEGDATELLASSDEIDSATLDGLLRHAARNNPSLRAAFARWQAALEQIPQMRALPDPRLSYEIMARVSPREHTVMLSQMFPWVGTLSLEQKMAEKEARIECTRFRILEREIFGRIKNDYYEYYYLSRRIAL
ncbi:MAG TPA: TolC family protein, partial [bacterium]|nr:TolC family protein [bacterium]